VKKISLVFALIVLLSFPSCTKSTGVLPYDQLPDDYSLENAKADGCIVFENLDITSGQSVWEHFIEKTTNGESSNARLAFYYTLNDPSQYSEEYYEEIQNDYPVLYIMDLSYDGEKFKLYHSKDGQKYSSEYKYLVKYTGKPRSAHATFSQYVYYVLVNDDSFTWTQVDDGMFSSQFGGRIDHYKVYSDLTPKTTAIVYMDNSL